jgi:Zn-dependent protease with chaperone function
MQMKKLSKQNLSNLIPHKAYDFMHYSHPTLSERVENLKTESNSILKLKLYLLKK